MNIKKIAAAVFLLAGLMATTATSCLADKNIVDDKQQLHVPGSDKPCYFLEIEVETASGGNVEEGETSVCVEKAEWDRNGIGSEWVGSDGRKK